ncbi:MAG TPA: diguanylate cyclase [Pyrinomonadaceae bacterium]
MAAPERDTSVERETQAHPPGWLEAQQSLAAATGLSILLIEGHQPPALAVSNNNSICQAFQSSELHAALCEPYCGRAYERALEAGAPVHYRCHAGLHCMTMPVRLNEGRQLAVIGGRAFLTSSDYRALAERIRIGDLQDLLSTDLFRNVVFASRQDLDDLSQRLAEMTGVYRQSAVKDEQGLRAVGVEESSEQVDKGQALAAVEQRRVADSSQEHETKAEVHQSNSPEIEAGPAAPTVYLPPDQEFIEVCGAAVKVLAEKHGLASVALFLRDKITTKTIYTSGQFSRTPVHLELGPKDSRLLLTARGGTSLSLCDSPEGLRPLSSVGKAEAAEQKIVAELFPLVVGDEVKGALLVGGKALSETKRRAISTFCHDNALPFEVLRLRSELDQRARFTDFLQTFTERINAIEPAETYRSILRHSVELLHSERGSILLLDETSNELLIKATVGPHTKTAAEARMRLGEGIAGSVLNDGRPLLVRDVETLGGQAAPPERRYKTKSFISYPILIGGRKVGVLNVTDKMGGGAFDEIDLSLLEVIAPQLAMALDRAEWREKAEQFELMSITDPLTGLLNRRYLEQRLQEEVNRSQRQQFEMGFMMIDIDDFKHYNDINGHQAGDRALEMTAQCLKSVLRSADIASRYGGEEFSILLPQTSVEEAALIAERIRKRIERTRFPHGKTQPHGSVTVSIGVSTFSQALDTPERIVGAADRALYLAKREGKNRVHIHAETPSDQLVEPPAKLEESAQESLLSRDASKKAK